MNSYHAARMCIVPMHCVTRDTSRALSATGARRAHVHMAHFRFPIGLISHWARF